MASFTLTSRQKKPLKKSAFTQFKSAAEGGYNRDEKSPVVRERGAGTATSVRSERGACTAEGVSSAMEVAGTVEGVC